jgi:hypothetical protein
MPTTTKSLSNVKLKVSYANKKVNNTLPTFTLPASNQNINDVIGVVMTYLNDLGTSAFKDVDTTITQNSTNPISSGAVYTALANTVGKNVTGTSYTINGETETAGAGAEIFNNYNQNKAIGECSHAEGLGTVAYGYCSHAEGQESEAGGDFSHAEGYRTTASGDFSHAEGSGTTASGYAAHAEGSGTTASGDFSHAEGYGTKASSANQHAQGEYNVADSNDKYAFIIGNGTANNARSNAFAIDWNGLIYVNNATTGVDVSSIASTIGDINTVLESLLGEEEGE